MTGVVQYADCFSAKGCVFPYVYTGYNTYLHPMVRLCNILAFDRAVNQETGASGRRYHLDLWTGWIRCRCDAHKKQMYVKQLYNRVLQTAWVSWCQLQLEFELQFEAVRTNSRQRACGPQWPPVEQPSKMRKKCCYSQRNLGSICCSLFPLQLTSHMQTFRNPFENTVWEVYFSKEVCSFVIIVDYVSAYICIRIVVSWLYNSSTLKALENAEYFFIAITPRSTLKWTVSFC